MKSAPGQRRRFRATAVVAGISLALGTVAGCSSTSQSGGGSTAVTSSAAASSAPVASSSEAGTSSGGASSSPESTAGSDTGSPSASATESSSAGGSGVAEACAAAPAEGGLNVRKTTDADVFQKEIEPFVAKYPDIKVTFVSQRPEDVVQQVVTTAKAGRAPDTDVADLALDDAKPLFDQKLVENIDWSTLEIPKENTVDINGIDVFRSQRELWGLSYNKDALSADQLPNTWAELIDPKWSGKLVVDPRASSMGYLAAAWGDTKTTDWYKNMLATLKPLVVEGETAGLLKVGSGEAELGLNQYDATVREQQANGVPIDIKYMTDVVGAKDHYAFVVAKTPHPNSAKCFLSWFGSPEGQAQQLKYEFKDNIARPDVVPKDAVLAEVNSFATMELAEKVSSELSKLTVG